jgi:adenylate cyclase
MVWEIDEFRAPRSGLILAELEIPSVDFSFERPDWVGEEVTGNPLFYNQNMT